MTCPQCGFDNPEGMAFCGQCGSHLYRRTGKRHETLDHLGTATTMFREMEMGLWLEEAEVALKELG